MEISDTHTQRTHTHATKYILQKENLDLNKTIKSIKRKIDGKNDVVSMRFYVWLFGTNENAFAQENYQFDSIKATTCLMHFVSIRLKIKFIVVWRKNKNIIMIIM